MVEILIAAVLGGLVGALGTAAWLRRSGAGARARAPVGRRRGGAAALDPRLAPGRRRRLRRGRADRLLQPGRVGDPRRVARGRCAAGVRTWEPLDADGRAARRATSARSRSRRAPASRASASTSGCARADGDVRWTTVSTRALHEEPAAERPLRGRRRVHGHHRAARGAARRSSAPTRSWPSSPTSPRTTSPSRCGWSPATCSCCAAATTGRSTRTPTSSSTSPSRARTGCAR